MSDQRSDRSLPSVVVRVDGSPLAADVAGDLVDARVEQAVSLPARCTLRFDDEKFSLFDSRRFALERSIEVLFGYGNTTESVFLGEVVTVGVEQGISNRHELVITAFDLSHRLTRLSKSRTFTNQKLSAIISKLAGEAGLTAKVDDTRIVIPHVTQLGSNREMLDLVAAQTGMRWRVESKTLVFGTLAVPDGPELTWGQNLVRFRARYSAIDAPVEPVMTRGWDPKTKKEIVGKSKTPAPKQAKTPLTDAVKLSHAGVVRGASAMVVQSQTEADQRAQALADRMAETPMSIRGEALGDPKIQAGGRVKIKGVGALLTGDYLLTEVEHVYGLQGGFTTRFTVAADASESLTDLLGRPSPVTAPFGSTGVVIGIVTNNNDPDKQGKVKVKFPTLALDEGKEIESTWARVLAVGAGPKRGLMFIPEVNDEVAVAFEHGDLRRPFVLGGLWGGQAALPKEEFRSGDQVAEWVVASRTGHSLAFRDGRGPADKAVEIKLDDGKASVHLGQDQVDITTRQRAIEITDGQSSIKLDGQGGIEIKANRISIQGQMETKVNGQQVKVEGQLKVEVAAPNVEVRGQASTKVSALGPLELQGAIVKIN